MKQCPSCGTTYTDDTLSYCLADGTRLNAAADEQATQVRSAVPAFGEKTAEFGKPEQMRIDIASERTNAGVAPVTVPAPAQPAATGGIFRIVAIVVALLFLVLLVVGGVGLLVYFNVPKDPIVTNVNKPATPTPTKSPSTTNNANDELRDQIANLQRQLDEQKKKAGVSNTVPVPLPSLPDYAATAKANSPTDGFLALRNLPSTDIGERVAKIPHGATVTIGACGPVMRSGSKSGHWCQARYNGMSGWVFDAYLIY